MIKTENITIKGKEYVKTYSDTGMMIARNGRKYSVVIEPINFVRKYVETDKPIPAHKTTEYFRSQRGAIKKEVVETEKLEIVETKEETIEQVE